MKPRIKDLVTIHCDGVWCKETVQVAPLSGATDTEVNQEVVRVGWKVIEYPTKKRTVVAHRCPNCADKPLLKVTCRANRSGYERDLIVGKTYEALYGLEAGIFSSDPYISVIGEDGQLCRAHASRFEYAKENHE